MPGVNLLGGRLDYLDGRSVAALVYRDGKHLANAYVWPTRDADRALRTTTERGFHVAHWVARGMAHWVVSDMSATAFATFTQALVRADAAP